MPAFTSLALAALRPVGRAVAGACRRLARALRAQRHRRAAAMLASLDERMLADIGLTRSDLRDAYAEPLWHDPTEVLARRAAERRSRCPRAAADGAGGQAGGDIQRS